MSTTTALPQAKAFPGTTVEAKLRSCLLELAASIASMQEVELPSRPSEQFAAAVQLDSLGVVDLLCDLEPIVGFELKDSIVKSGGYGSINEAVTHLMPRIEEAWKKNAGKGVKK
jgi:hypothetical protein